MPEPTPRKSCLTPRSRLTRLTLPVIIAALALFAAACGGNKESSSDAPGVNAAAADAQITMSLTEFALSPSELQVPADQAFTIHVTNDGGAPHTFAIDAGGRRYETAIINPGGMEMLEIPALEAGEYDMLCTVTGHDSSGMVGTIVVGGDATGASGASASSHTDHSNLTVQQMLEMHEAGVKSFPAETEGTGATVLEPKMDGDVKVYELTAEEIQWEVEPGKLVPAMAYNGTVPGPELRLHEGDQVRVILRNRMEEPTTLHWHGLRVPNEMDGVPYITQDPILEGEDFTYEFTVRNDPGTYLYHSHFNSTDQVNKGLFGPIIIEPEPGSPEARRYDGEHTMILHDGPLGFTLNGKGFPATAPIVAGNGDEILIHMANVGSALHPMHMHGYEFRVVGEDGKKVPRPYWANTLVVPPGKTFDVAVRTNEPGVWAFHCHILSHVEGPQGMFGMVTALVVE